MEIKFMGLSGHLQHNALGHFETFHKAIMEGFQVLLGPSNVQFLGLQKSNNEDFWFDPLIPTSLTSTISWLPRKFLNSLGTDLDTKKEAKIIYVYEGNLSNLFLFGRVARRSKGVFLYFNLFNTNKYSSVLNSPIKFLLFRLLFQLALRGADEKICFVADTPRFSAFLSSKLGRTFFAFPMYSGLNLPLPKIRTRNINLVNVRGIRAERLFKQAVDNEPNLSKIQMEVYGMLNEDIKLYLKKYSNIMVSNSHVDENSYFASYSKYSSVTFLYDPDFFSMQSSGRLADAVVSGARLLVPKGTSLEDVLMEYGNGTSFDFEDDASLALALLSKPCISRTAKDLPTNYWAATTILHSVKSLIEKSEQKRENKVTKIGNFALDEAVWVSLWVLRLIFGLRRRLAKSISLKGWWPAS
jgi:hypothetical protein